MNVLEKHPCDIGEGEIDHTWELHSDSDDSGSWYYWECDVCGEIDNEREPPDYGDER